MKAEHLGQDQDRDWVHKNETPYIEAGAPTAGVQDPDHHTEPNILITVRVMMSMMWDDAVNNVNHIVHIDRIASKTGLGEDILGQA